MERSRTMHFFLPEIKTDLHMHSLIENDRFILINADNQLLFVYNKIRNAFHPLRSLPDDCHANFPSRRSHLLGFYDDNHFGLLLSTLDYKSEDQSDISSGDEECASTKCELAIIKASVDYNSFSLVSTHPVLNVMMYADAYPFFHESNSPWLIFLADSLSVEVYQIQPDVLIGRPMSSQYLGGFECNNFRDANCAVHNHKLYIIQGNFFARRHERNYTTNKITIYDLQLQVLQTLPLVEPCPFSLTRSMRGGPGLALAGRFLVFPRNKGRPHMFDMAELRWVNDDSAGSVDDDNPRKSVDYYSLTTRGNLIQRCNLGRQKNRQVSIRPLSVPTLLELTLRVIHSTVTEQFASCLSESDVSTPIELVETLTGERQWKRHRGSEDEIERGIFAYPDYDHGKYCRPKPEIISRGALMLLLCPCATRGEGSLSAHVWVFNRARNAWTHCVPLAETTKYTSDGYDWLRLLQFISDDTFVALSDFYEINDPTTQIRLVTYRLSSQLNRAERIASRVLVDMQHYQVYNCDIFYDSDKPWLLAVMVDNGQNLFDIYQVFENEVVLKHRVKYPVGNYVYGWKGSRVYMLGRDDIGGVVRMLSFDANGTNPIVEVPDPGSSFNNARMDFICITRLWNGCLVNPWQNGRPHLFDVKTNEWRDAGNGRDRVLKELLCAHISSEGELLRCYRKNTSMHVTSYWLSIPPLSTICSRFIHSKIRLDWAKRLKESDVSTYEELVFFLAKVPTGQLYEV